MIMSPAYWVYYKQYNNMTYENVQLNLYSNTHRYIIGLSANRDMQHPYRRTLLL